MLADVSLGCLLLVSCCRNSDNEGGVIVNRRPFVYKGGPLAVFCCSCSSDFFLFPFGINAFGNQRKLFFVALGLPLRSPAMARSGRTGRGGLRSDGRSCLGPFTRVGAGCMRLSLLAA